MRVKMLPRKAKLKALAGPLQAAPRPASPGCRRRVTRPLCAGSIVGLPPPSRARPQGIRREQETLTPSPAEAACLRYSGEISLGVPTLSSDRRIRAPRRPPGQPLEAERDARYALTASPSWRRSTAS